MWVREFLGMHSPRSSRTAARVARARLAALVAVPVLALCAACGGDGGGGRDEGIASVPSTPSGETATAVAGSPSPRQSGTEGKGAFYDAQMAYVQCMRSKAGIKDFPDPKLSGYLDWSAIDELVQETGNREIYKGGRKGGETCTEEMHTAMQLEPKRDVSKDYESMLAHATCMRDHGVSAFTNPVMSGGNVLPGGDPNPTSPKIDPRSPAYKQARQACKDKLLDGLDGMQ